LNPATGGQQEEEDQFNDNQWEDQYEKWKREKEATEETKYEE